MISGRIPTQKSKLKDLRIAGPKTQIVYNSSNQLGRMMMRTFRISSTLLWTKSIAGAKQNMEIYLLKSKLSS
jgi:hypothetical protein